jgi:hypothetical protein
MIITVTEPKACDACKRNITHSKLCSFCAEKRIAELESCICETCHDPACEDSAMEYWRARAKRFEAVLKEIGDGNALCEVCKGCPLVDSARDAIEGEKVGNET